MKTKAALLAALAALAANAVQMATENWVSNRLTEATAPIRESVAALNSATQTMQSAIVSLNSATQTIQTTVSDLATNTYTKAETDAKIVELSPAPGNYATVSNRAMTAIQSHQSLHPSTNYTDAALGAFASTGSVSRAATYGTPTRWTDATGCVWEVETAKAPWHGGPSSPLSWDEETRGWISANGQDLLTWISGTWMLGCGTWTASLECTGEQDAMRLELHGDGVPNIILERIPLTNLVGRVALTNDISQAFSTNNSAFVSAVLAVPIVGADASDIAELSEYGSYGTVGAAILALIAGLAALKRRMTSAESALAQKASLTDLPYDLVEPGEWKFSGRPEGATDVGLSWSGTMWLYTYAIGTETSVNPIIRPSTEPPYDGNELSLTFSICSLTITATRASLPGHLCDRANNLIDATTGNVTLTLPPFAEGKVRDLLVACTIGLDANDEPWSVIFQGSDGEGISFKADGDDASTATFPVPDAAGDWWYSLTERAPHVFAVSLKQLQSVSQTQGGS